MPLFIISITGGEENQNMGRVGVGLSIPRPRFGRAFAFGVVLIDV